MRLIVGSCVATLLAGLCGCTSDDYLRAEGVTTGAGDAIAANTAMQMVDPWQYGVQNTRLLIPAERGPETNAADSSASANASQTTGN